MSFKPPGRGPYAGWAHRQRKEIPLKMRQWMIAGLLILFGLAGCDSEDQGPTAAKAEPDLPAASSANAEIPLPEVDTEPSDVSAVTEVPTPETDAEPATLSPGVGTETPPAEETASSPGEPTAFGKQAGRFESVDGVIEPGEYAHEVRVGGMDVFWSNDAELLWMGLSAPATGYVAVGFDPVRRKVGANYIIGYVKDGEAIIRDHVGTRGNLHEADTDVGGTDDLLASDGTEANGRTVLEFVIPLDSGDEKDRPLQPGESYELQTAYQENRDDLISWHSRHGTGSLDLDPAP